MRWRGNGNGNGQVGKAIGPVERVFPVLGSERGLFALPLYGSLRGRCLRVPHFAGRHLVGIQIGWCVGVSFRFEGLTFEMETQLLYGGTTHAFDWTFPLSFVIPLANEKSLFDGGYLRFGGSPVGATFAHQKDGGNFVRFGLFAGRATGSKSTNG